ncbi:hypothetical protein I3760_09G165700 [Carya illinoinensis]|nr:hypothetical protein I3760_09G165700 [Carya illinoinensis]
MVSPSGRACLTLNPHQMDPIPFSTQTQPTPIDQPTHLDPSTPQSGQQWPSEVNKINQAQATQPPNTEFPSDQAPTKIHSNEEKIPRKRKETPSGNRAYLSPPKHSNPKPTVGEDEISSNSPSFINTRNQQLGDNTTAFLFQPGNTASSQRWISRRAPKKHRFSPYKLEDEHQ